VVRERARLSKGTLGRSDREYAESPLRGAHPQEHRGRQNALDARRRVDLSKKVGDQRPQHTRGHADGAGENGYVRKLQRTDKKGKDSDLNILRGALRCHVDSQAFVKGKRLQKRRHRKRSRLSEARYVARIRRNTAGVNVVERASRG